MTIENISLKNWRSIGKKGISLELGRINVLSGVNDAGKTSVLLAFYSALYYANSEYPNSYLIKHLHEEGSLHFDGNNSNETSIEIISSFPEIEIKQFIEKIIKTSFLKDMKLSTLFIEKMKLKFSINNVVAKHKQGWSLFFYLQNSEILINLEKEINLRLSMNRSYISSSESENHFPMQVNCFFISSNRYYELSSEQDFKENKIPMYFEQKEINKKVYNISKLDNDLLNMVNFIKSINNEKNRNKGTYNKLLSYIKIIFPEVIRLDVSIPDGSEIEDVFIEWNINGVEKRQPLSRSGSGVVSIIYLAGRMLNDIKSNLITIGFIDEPEIGIHPKLQVRFLKLLRQLSEDFNVQWMLSTHSPFIMKNLKEEDRLFLLEHNGIESTVKNINPADKSIVFQAIGAYLPDTLTAKCIIFVEGATESNVLPILLERYGIDIDEKGIVIMPLGGDNLYSIKPQELLKINSNVMVILDSDLVKPLSEGGSISSKKLEYENDCKSSNINIVMPREYRTIENMYPRPTLAKILNIPLEPLTYSNFAKVECIPDSKKVKIGIQVAEQMTKDEIKNFPLIKEILNWLD